MKNILWIAGLVGLIGQSEAGISKKNTGNGIEMIIKRVRDYSRITSGTKGKNFRSIFGQFSVNFYDFSPINIFRVESFDQYFRWNYQWVKS